MSGVVTEEEARAVMRAASRWLGVREDQFFVADHEHNGTSPGTWTVAMEGWNGETPWPYLFTAAVRGTLREASSTPPVLPDGVLLDCYSSWAITVYRREGQA